MRLAALTLMTAAGALLAIAGGYLWWAGAAFGAALALAVAVVLTAPQAVAIGLVLLAYIPALYPVAFLLVLSADTAGTATMANAFAAATSLMLAAVIAAWIAVRYSRGRAWVTLALTLAASALVGVPLAGALRGWGLYAAYLSMAVVLALRCGVWAWVSGSVALAWARLHHRDENTATPAVRADLDGWLQRADAELATAAALDGISSEHTVFHDLNVGKKIPALAHLVIGPGGVFVIASVTTTGDLREDPAQGVQLPGVELADVTGALLAQRTAVAKALKLRESGVHALVAVRGSGEVQRTLAVFSRTDGDLPSAHVRLVDTEHLAGEIDAGIAVMSSHARSAAVYRVGMRLRPAGASTPARLSGSTELQLATVDESGITHRPDPLAGFDWVTEGLEVDVATSRGVLRDLVVTTPPYVDEHGRAVVKVCVSEEWAAAGAERRKPDAYPYPVSALLAVQ